MAVKGNDKQPAELGVLYIRGVSETRVATVRKSLFCYLICIKKTTK